MGADVGGETAGLRGLVLRREHLAAFRKGHAGVLADEVLAGLDGEVWTRRRRERLAEPDPDQTTAGPESWH